MHSFVHWNTNLRVVAAAAATIGLAAGCCSSHSTRTASYSPPPAYAGGTAEEGTPAPAPAAAPAATAEGTMVVPLYQESVNVGKREVDAGSVRLKKIVKTETVNVPVQLRREEVVIDRDNNAQGGQILAQQFQEQETTIQLKREEPVIDKQTTSAGKIVVQKRFTEEQKNLQAQVRREDIDVQKEGNAENVIIGEKVHAAGPYGAGESPGGQASATATSGQAITDPAVFYTTTDDKTYIGRPVRFDQVKVRKVVGNRLVILGEENRRVYVIPDQNAPLPAEGDTVVITGTVKKTPDSVTELGLSGDAAQTFGSQPYYIEAQKIEIPGK